MHSAREVPWAQLNVYLLSGIRAMLHTREGGLLTPPLPSETIAEATTSASFRIERCCS